MELQWRTPLALEEGESGALRDIAKDSEGNLLVGWSLYGPTYGKSVISKLDEDGNELWRFSLPETFIFNLKEIGTDASGNVYFVVPTALEEGSGNLQLTVIKLSPAGEELWRCPLGEEAWETSLMDFTMSPSGTVWVAYFEGYNPDVSSPDQGVFIKKISNEGDIVWSDYKIINLYISMFNRPDQILAIDESENAYFAWQSKPVVVDSNVILKSHIRKINADGETVWEKEIPALLVLDIMTGPSEAVCVSGSGGMALFDSDGELTGRTGGTQDYCRIMDFLPNGQMLVTWSSSAGLYLQLTGPDMQPVWRGSLNSFQFFSIVRNPAGGWLLGGYKISYTEPPSIVTLFESVGADGTRLWRQESPSFIEIDGSFGGIPFFMEAFNDRLFVFSNNEWSFSETSVIAARFSLPPELPSNLFAAFPEGGIWQKGQPHSLSVTSAGAGPFTYKWYRQGVMIPDQTGPTLELSPAQFPAAHGYYHAEISYGDQTMASPVALVDLNGIYLESLGLTEYGTHKLRICAPIGMRFALEYSNDFLNWGAASIASDHFETSEESYVNAPTVFFRAVRVE